MIPIESTQGMVAETSAECTDLDPFRPGFTVLLVGKICLENDRPLLQDLQFLTPGLEVERLAAVALRVACLLYTSDAADECCGV